MYYNAEKWQKAIALLDHCEPYFKDTYKADTIAFYKARSYFKDRDYMTASEKFDEFRRSFGRSAFIEDAEALYAVSLYNMCPAPERDQSTTARAIVAISEFLSHYPNSTQKPLFDEMTTDLTWRMHEKAYINAYTYYKIGHYNSAIVAFRNAIQKYPTSHRREDLMYYVVKASFDYAENSVESKQEDRYLAMLDNYYSFIAAYPESKHIKELTRMSKDARNFLDKQENTEL